MANPYENNTSKAETAVNPTDALDVKKNDVKDETGENIENLSNNIINQQLELAEVKSEAAIIQAEFKKEQEIKNYDNFLTVLSKLLEYIDYTRKWLSTKWQNKAWRETMRQAKGKLNNYEKALKRKIDWLSAQKGAEIFDADISDAREIFQKINEVRYDIGRWQWWEFSNIATILYNSPEEIRKANRSQERAKKFETTLTEEMKDGAILKIFNDNGQEAKNFYRRISEWNYTNTDYAIYTAHADILSPSFQRCGIIIVDPNINPSEKQENVPISVDYSNQSWWETFKKWWIAAGLDRLLSNCNNLTPWQRNTRKTIWVLAGFWAWIFWLYKFFTSKKLNFWQKAWITAGTILGTQILTWEWPLSLFNKLMTWWLSWDELRSKFWNAFWSAWKTWVEEFDYTIAPAMYSMMIFNSNTKVSDIHDMTNRFKQNNDEWKIFYQQSITKLNDKYWWASTVEYFRTTFSDQFDEWKRKAWLASFWVTDNTNANESLYGLSNNATMNATILNKFKSENWLKETNNKAKKAELQQYINDKKAKNQPIDIDDLTYHLNDWFIIDNEATFTDRDVDKKRKENFVNQIDGLSIDDTKKAELKTAIQKFYDERTIESKPLISDFELKMDGNLLVVKSHKWKETKIDLEQRELVWFWAEIKFTDIADLLDAADLTNYILSLQKWKDIANLPPFKYKAERRGICFNDADLFSINFDTKILSIWTAKHKINALSKDLDGYSSYLSDRRLQDNKVEINATTYPILKDLSDKTWIVFTKEQEIQNLWNFLETIKRTRWSSHMWKLPTPYDISLLDGKLIFTAVDWTKYTSTEKMSESFPTVIMSWNKTEFLKYLNNPDNHMYLH